MMKQPFTLVLQSNCSDMFHQILTVMKWAASYKHRQAVKTIQGEKKLFNSHLYSS